MYGKACPFNATGHHTDDAVTKADAAADADIASVGMCSSYLLQIIDDIQAFQQTKEFGCEM